MDDGGEWWEMPALSAGRAGGRRIGFVREYSQTEGFWEPCQSSDILKMTLPMEGWERLFCVKVWLVPVPFSGCPGGPGFDGLTGRLTMASHGSSIVESQAFPG